MVKILSPLITFSSTVPSFLMKDALSSALYVALIANCWILPIMISHKRYFLATHPKLLSNNFKIITASIGHILSSKRFDEPLFKINSFISSSVNPNLINNFLFHNRQFCVLHIYLLLLLVALYPQVLSAILVSGDRVTLFACVFFCLYFT